VLKSIGTVLGADIAGRVESVGPGVRRLAPGDEVFGVAAGLKGGLADGTYTVTWRIVSGDAHPIGGAFRFSVGAPSAGAAAGGVASQVSQGGSPRYVGGLFAAVRFLDFMLVLGLAGGAISLTVVTKDAGDAIRNRLLGIVGILGAALAIVVPLGIVLQGAKGSGTGVRDALDWNVLRAVLDPRFGQVWLAEAIAGVAIVYLVLGAGRLRGRARRWAEGAALTLALLLVLGPASSGHARVNGMVSFVADVAHVEAAAAWAGGLAFLVLALNAASDRWELATRAVPRFSTLAVLSVAALLVAGVINGYLEVRAWSGLWETMYGRLLLAKVALVLPLLGLGAYHNRVSTPRLKAGVRSSIAQRRFLRSTGIELGLMVAVVAVTALLVAEPPPRTSATRSGAATPNATARPAGVGPGAVYPRPKTASAPTADTAP
jgi:copper transport protein